MTLKAHKGRCSRCGHNSDDYREITSLALAALASPPTQATGALSEETAEPYAWFWSDGSESGVLTLRQDFERHQRDYPSMRFTPVWATPRVKRAALSSAKREAEPQWLPIESAPRDGTEVLLWRDDCGQFIGSNTTADAFPLEQKELDELTEEELSCRDWFTQWPDARRLEGSEVPTLWQSLPTDPSGEAKHD